MNASWQQLMVVDTLQTPGQGRVDILGGEGVSALTDQGTITFPDYPRLDNVEISESRCDGIGANRQIHNQGNKPDCKYKRDACRVHRW
jgi:hypothetical protein